MVWLSAINYMVIVVVLLFISWQDIMLRTITHRSLLYLLLSLLPLLLQQNWQLNFFAALTIFTVGFLLFIANAIGGGDVKLMALLALFVPEGTLTHYLLLTAFLGGAIVIVGLLFFRRSLRENGVPYGVAISFSFIFVIPFHLGL